MMQRLRLRPVAGVGRVSDACCRRTRLHRRRGFIPRVCQVRRRAIAARRGEPDESTIETRPDFGYGCVELGAAAADSEDNQAKYCNKNSDAHWHLELEDHLGGSTVWDDAFESIRQRSELR